MRINEDVEFEGDETFYVYLDNTQGVTLAIRVNRSDTLITLIDNDNAEPLHVIATTVTSTPAISTATATPAVDTDLR